MQECCTMRTRLCCCKLGICTVLLWEDLFTFSHRCWAVWRSVDCVGYWSNENMLSCSWNHLVMMHALLRGALLWWKCPSKHRLSVAMKGWAWSAMMLRWYAVQTLLIGDQGLKLCQEDIPHTSMLPTPSCIVWCKPGGSMHWYCLYQNLSFSIDFADNMGTLYYGSSLSRPHPCPVSILLKAFTHRTAMSRSRALLWNTDGEIW